MGKAPGLDSISIELLKAAGQNGMTILHQLCCKIWKSETWPKEWCTEQCVLIPKKGNLQRCENHRTIALIPHASKILLIIIQERLKKKLDEEIAKKQAGFRTGPET